jgi:heat-inducible transcriptional repressor
MLSQRKAELLKTLIGEYIVSASPVASEAVARKRSLGLSPATIRNEMADLEEEGYISRPYTSAGAVPSDKGYRFYVETLTNVTELPQEFQYTIRYQFTRAERDIEGWTRLAAMVLAQLVSNAALVTYPKWPETRLLRVDLVYVQESLALLILVLQETKLRKQLLPLGESLDGEGLQMTANRLSDSLGGLSRQEILAKRQELSAFDRQITDAVTELMEHEDQALYVDHYVEGLRHLLNQPEFAAGEKAREIVEVLEDKELPRAVLAEAPEWGHMKVVIGGENRATFLRPFSVVVCQYGLPGGGLGSISAIGPTRMEYSRTMAGVQFISSLMTELVSQVHG